ncbi:MAG: hypothetical protein HYY16_01755 [Planctomycetes bacterium]|nr:hypothetical protein [Planctomycetota bacterium]
MWSLLPILWAVACVGPPRPSAWEYRVLLVDSETFVEESLAVALAETAAAEERAGAFGRPLSEAAELWVIPLPPRRPRALERVVAPPYYDHALIERLTRELRTRPDEAPVYDMRARAEQHLGLRRLAEVDRERVRTLREPPAPEAR